MPPLDHDRCYAAAASRDARFDGHFVTAVRTTRIYCRPSCPAITPKPTNVEFHPTAAAAQQRGFRACKRCLPDATPGSPEWDLRRDVVGRAMRLITDGEIERSGVGGLAARLGYSTRHLNRLLTDELGAGPLAIARARRAHTARILIETTDLRLTDVAFAAGFGSVRQFNDTVREVYDASPSDLRARGRRAAVRSDRSASGQQTSLRLRLPYRGPLDARSLTDWFVARAVDGVETIAGEPSTDSPWRHTRTLSTPGGDAVVSIEIVDEGGGSSIMAEVALGEPADLPVVVERVRRLYDLDADPVAIDEHLGADEMLRPLVHRRPGLRSPGSIDLFETAVRAVIGQQISVAGARTVAAQLVAACGGPATSARQGDPTRLFPTPTQLLDAPDDAFAMPERRRETLRRLAHAVATGDLVLDIGVDPDVVRHELQAIDGIGPWTADYVVLRGCSDPDVALVTDLVAARTASRLGLGRDLLADHAARRWSPWRSYATHHLWAAASDPASPTDSTKGTP